MRVRVWGRSRSPLIRVSVSVCITNMVFSLAAPWNNGSHSSAGYTGCERRCVSHIETHTCTILLLHYSNGSIYPIFSQIRRLKGQISWMNWWYTDDLWLLLWKSLAIYMYICRCAYIYVYVHILLFLFIYLFLYVSLFLRICLLHCLQWFRHSIPLLCCYTTYRSPLQSIAWCRRHGWTRTKSLLESIRCRQRAHPLEPRGCRPRLSHHQYKSKLRFS